MAVSLPRGGAARGHGDELSSAGNFHRQANTIQEETASFQLAGGK